MPSINILALLLSWILLVAMQVVSTLLESDPQKEKNRFMTAVAIALYFPPMVLLALVLDYAIG